MTMFNTKKFDLETEQAAFNAGYLWRQTPPNSVYGPYQYGLPPLLKNADTEEEARHGMVAVFNAHKKQREADEKAYLEKQQAKQEQEAYEKALEARVKEANARNAAQAGYSIKRRPDGLQGWTGGGSGLDWDTLEEAIDSQAKDAHRHRQHAEYRQRVARSVTEAGGEVRAQKGGTLAVYLPPAHERAPKQGELFNGLIYSFSGRGWADIEALMKIDMNRPATYPVDQ